MTAPPFRFLGLVIGGWIFGRVALLVPGVSSLSVGTAVAVAGIVTVPIMMDVREEASLPSPAPSVTVALDQPTQSRGGDGLTIWLDQPALPPALPAAIRLATLEIIPVPPPAVPQPVETASPAEGGSRSRWSGSAWLFTRSGEDRAALAAGGQLGGSQAGVRLAYRIAELGPGSIALAGRFSTPLRTRHGAEAALGVDWHPVAKLPVRLSIERRIAVGRDGRDAWSAYAAGGFYRGGLPGGLEMDGYAQAGVVGARSRDLFADGAVRIGRAVPLSDGKRLVLGVGAWGAAQPGASRLDVGPRAALSVPVAGAVITGAVEGRVRIAGDAAPGTGAAFTLASDF